MIQQTSVQLPNIKLVGIVERTNNAHEMDSATAKIGPCVQKYFSQGLPERIVHRKQPGKTFCVYTDYASDFRGDYTYFIGEEVTTFDDLSHGFVALTISTQQYAKLTTAPGPMPEVCIDLWQKIWQMTPEELGGNRGYLADFEVYDERAQDPQKTVLDIYIGVE